MSIVCVLAIFGFCQVFLNCVKRFWIVDIKQRIMYNNAMHYQKCCVIRNDSYRRKDSCHGRKEEYFNLHGT